MKILAWDIEAGSLNANIGICLCIGYKWVGEDGPPTVISIADTKEWKKDRTDDSGVLKAFLKVAESADAWFTWYGKRFDVPFVNSRLLYHGLQPLPPVQHIDGWFTAKYRLKLTSNRMGSVSEFLGIPTEKTPVKFSVWLKAICGDRDALGYIVEHCEKDVLVAEAVYERLKPIIINHPNRRLTRGDDDILACPVCGSETLHRRGEYVTRTRVYRRYQCQSCGAWSKGAKSLRSAPAVAA